MARNIETSIYLGAFILSVAVFAIGIYVGHILDQNNLISISHELSNISNRMASLQILLLSDSDSSSFCPVYLTESENLDQEIEQIGYKLSFLEDEKQIFDDNLKRAYFTLEAESYFLAKKTTSLCNESDILLINFYSNKNCGQICKDQGVAVIQARDELAAEGIVVKLFSFDGELDSPIAEAFESEYHVLSYPTLVINEKTYSGFQSAEQIKEIIRASAGS